MTANGPSFRLNILPHHARELLLKSLRDLQQRHSFGLEELGCGVE